MFQTAVVRIQAVYRGYSVRVFLERAVGKSLLAGRASIDEGDRAALIPAPPVLGGRDKTAPAARVRQDCALRRRWEREAAIAEVKHLDEESSRQAKR